MRGHRAPTHPPRHVQHAQRGALSQQLQLRRLAVPERPLLEVLVAGRLDGARIGIQLAAAVGAWYRER